MFSHSSVPLPLMRFPRRIRCRYLQFDENSMQQEIQIMKKVSHPNCIRLYEVENLCPKPRSRVRACWHTEPGNTHVFGWSCLHAHLCTGSAWCLSASWLSLLIFLAPPCLTRQPSLLEASPLSSTPVCVCACEQVFDEKLKIYIVLELVTGGELFDRIIDRVDAS
jgi:serine/threonine protein kinase